ncbi:MAG: universal stress protein [Euryarchaeota archaeon]|nr:universal stress protein [Euryarchaeota archaeon]MBU4607784.1 universal stress protein [Euryarchaeota archaeon]
MSKADVEDVILGFKKILLATDGSKPSVLATKYAVGMAKLFNAEMIAIFVDEQFALLPQERMSEEEYEGIKHTKAGLKVAEWYAEKSGVPIETICKRGNAPKNIVRIAEKHGVDLIIMGTTGRTGLKRITIGSVAEMVMKAAHVPVLVVR